MLSKLLCARFDAEFPGTFPNLNLVAEQVRAVGSLLSHSMHYIPDADSVEVQIEVAFVAAMQLVPGDVVLITLPGFTGESTECVRIAEVTLNPEP